MSSRQSCNVCKFYFLDINAHQRSAHRDGIVVETPFGKRIAVRLESRKFLCPNGGCGHEDASTVEFSVSSGAGKSRGCGLLTGTSQNHAKTCKATNNNPLPQVPLPTPPDDDIHPTDEDVVMIDNTPVEDDTAEATTAEDDGAAESAVPEDRGDHDTEPTHQPEPEDGTFFLQWTPETVQTAEMKRVGLVVNTAARVVICLGCQSAIKPPTLYRHINHTHYPLTATRKFCSDLVEKHNLIQDPQRPFGVITAIFGLPLSSKHLSCDNCGAAFQTKPSILRHIREVPGCSSAGYQTRPTQSLFPQSNRQFFGVDILSDSPACDPNNQVALIKKFYSPTPFHALPITAAHSFRDANHFLRVEHWEEHVEGMTGEVIHKVVREREPQLRETVLTVVEMYARNMVKELTGTDHAIKVAIGDYNG